MPSRRAFAPLAALLIAGALPTSAGAAGGFDQGVASSEVTDKTARLWTRAPRTGRVTLEIAPDSSFRRGLRLVTLRARATSDETVQTAISGLRPGTRYAYRFRQRGRTSEIGRFRTAPSPNADATIKFAWTGDSDPVKRPNSRKLFFGPFKVFERMAAARNDFNVNLGDTIYSDTDSELERVDPLALSVGQKRAKYRAILEDRALRRMRAASGTYNHWDDHEFLNDFAIDQTRYPTASGTEEGESPRVVTVDGRKLYRDGVKAFREYMPVTYSRRDGIYRSVRWGRNLELFFLDERSFRDAGADDGGTCDSPAGSGRRDLAPTAPQERRSQFAALAPSLAVPPPPACLARIADPNRTLLGKRQYDDFTRAIRRSTATFKVIMNELPIQQYYVDPYDRWEGYAAERERLITFLRGSVKNVVFLTADVHANLVNDVRLRTLEPGGPVNSGITEITTGPSGTDSFRDDLNDELGIPQGADLANNLFLRRPPPEGPGIRCANIDTDSYGQVKVTRRALTVTLRDESGKRVLDPDGKPCGPYRIARR
jgi:alkaline phosphatase D